MIDRTAPVAPRRGLTAEEAARRFARDGPNELPARGEQGLLRLLLHVLAEPMLLLLVAAVALYLVLGEAREALILAGSLVFVVGITVYQERRTEHALAALRDLSSPRALVVRDGVQQRVAGREVVQGDLLVVGEGDRIAADALLRESVALEIDESLLTGESVPVRKRADPGEPPLVPPGGEDQPFVYSGTLALHGHGLAEVIATGAATQMGRIGHALARAAPERTPLQRETARMVRWLALAGLVLCAAVVVLLTATRGSFLDALLAGITLAMSVLPEEFPVVLTVFLALGAWRISRVGVLTRRAAAIEALGAATVLAVDKTGTLTENRMQVALVATTEVEVALPPVSPLPAQSRRVLEVALAACERNLLDPMERAIAEAAEALVPEAGARLADMRLVHEYELSDALLAVVHVWRASEAPSATVAAKGAPEAIAGLCRLDDSARAALLATVSRHAAAGLRVLGVAHARHDGEAFPDDPSAFAFSLDGLVGLADPVRASVPEAIAECHRAGIRVVMITGDYPQTALAAAGAAGLEVTGGVVSGGELASLDAAALTERVRAANVYARILPTQKLQLVDALKASGAIVAMTGDGINDAPALKAAHIGVAMGRRGTDVAREAAALVLLDDDFGSLVATVRAGRRIYENIRQAMGYLLAVHVPLGGMGLIPALAGWPLFFLPIHVVFLEFIIDPACSLVFEAEAGSEALMRQPPRRADARIFSPGLTLRAVTLGLAMLVAVAATYGIALRALDEGHARAMAFTVLIAANLALITVSRSRTERLGAILRHRNRANAWIVVLALTALAIALYLPPVAQLFLFVPLAPGELGLALALGIASVVWLDVVRPRRRAA